MGAPSTWRRPVSQTRKPKAHWQNCITYVKNFRPRTERLNLSNGTSQPWRITSRSLRDKSRHCICQILNWVQHGSATRNFIALCNFTSTWTQSLEPSRFRKAGFGMIDLELVGMSQLRNCCVHYIMSKVAKLIFLIIVNINWKMNLKTKDLIKDSEAFAKVSANFCIFSLMLPIL
jgi:hypothetical protein